AMSNFTTLPLPVLVTALMIVVAMALMFRLLRILILVGLLAVAAWKTDFSYYLGKASQYGETHIPQTLDQVHVAHFVLGLVSGIIIFSTLLFVRPFAKLALVAATIAILSILGFEGVPGLMRYAAAALHLLEEFNFFAKGLVAGKFCAGLMKWRQIRRRGLPS